MDAEHIHLPLFRHPHPHKELWRRHRHYWTRRDFRISAVFAILVFVASLFVQTYAVNFATENASNFVTDIVLSNTPVFNVDWLFVYGMFFFIAFVAILCLTHPKRIPFTLYSLALFIVIRALFVSLTHLSPFPVQTEIDFGTAITRVFFGADLFFSGHTGAPFLMALIFWREKILRFIFLIWSVFFGVVVLLGHLHYSIDVLSAFFITYGIFHIAQFLFQKEHALFLSEMSEGVLGVATPVIKDPVEKRIFQVFEIAVVLKGLNAILEFSLGVLLMFTNVVNDIVVTLVQNELIEDPNDFLATYIQSLVSSSPHAQFVGALYLISHGVVKAFLMASLLRNKIWAYPATIAVLTLFILYQLIRFINTQSAWLLVLSAFDVFVVWLVWHEYKRVSKTPK